MPRHRVIRGGLVTLGVLVGLAVSAAIVLAATTRTGRHPLQLGQAPSLRTISLTCPSPSLGGKLPVLVYLPPGYSTSGRPYPVVYFLHGLPADPESYTQNAFVAQGLVSAGASAIVVAPQGARSANSDREYLDWSATENWPRAISRDLTRCVDQRFNTIVKRTGRMLIGLSAGGYGAMNIGLRHLSTFAAVESWSGYFDATDPSGYHVLQFPTAQAQKAAEVPSGSTLVESLKRWPSLIGFYVGTSDDRFLDTNEAFDSTLHANRIAHVFRTYPGGHSSSLWQAQAPAWLAMALKYMATGRVTPP